MDGSGGLPGLLDFLPASLRVGGFAVGTSRLFGSYAGALANLRRGSDSAVLDVGSGAARVSSDAVTGFVGKNLLGYTENFSSGWNVTGGSLASSSVTGPDGNAVTALLLTENTSNSTHIAFPIALAAATESRVASISFSAKANGRSKIFVQMQAGGGYPKQYFDLSNNTKLNSIAAYTSTIVDAGNGWSFITVSSIAYEGLTGYAAVGLLDNTGTLSYTGDGTSGLRICKPQLEYGSTATTYEARTTTGASACYVPKLYDQIGANNALQINGGYQPQIIPRQIGEMPIIVGDGVDDRLKVAGLLTEFNDKDLSLIVAGKNSVVGNLTTPQLYYGSNNSYNAAGNLAHANSGLRRVISMIASDAAQTSYVNGVSAATASAARVATWTDADFYLGAGGAAFGNPSLSTILVPTALDATNRSAIESRLTTEYSIT